MEAGSRHTASFVGLTKQMYELKCWQGNLEGTDIGIMFLLLLPKKPPAPFAPKKNRLWMPQQIDYFDFFSFRRTPSPPQSAAQADCRRAAVSLLQTLQNLFVRRVKRAAFKLRKIALRSSDV